ncbi:unnamed protein product [Brachionus calyciflorus]|uniref:T cell CD4 receptor C-terminal region domain-containing protein n=1 Tax=Brachionus calyciflorus TaxID=104777 RepID=A0A813RPD3_9BILA|nr:unnamed protein product [Brachionus calyciflorus]
MLFFTLFLVLGLANCESLRVLKQFARHVEIQCPIINNILVEQIKWIKEDRFYDKPDESVVIDQNCLIVSSQLKINLYDSFNYVSCGYISNNNKYVRLKSWQFTYIDTATTELKITNNPSNTKYTILNQTHSSLALAKNYEFYNWNQAIDFLRFKCINNFDLPYTRRFVWLYLFNSDTCTSETWHKYDLDIEEGYNIYQIFNNPNSHINQTFSYFVKLLFSEKQNHLTLQCGSYYETQMLAQSNLLALLNGGFFKSSHTNWALIGGIIGGILGFLLLLCLLGLLIFCCLRCRKRKNTKKKTEILSENKSDNFVSTVPINVTNLTSNSNTNINSNLNSTQINNNLSNHNGTYRVQPEYYLNILEIHPDPVVDEELENCHHHHHHITTETYHHQHHETSIAAEQSYRQEQINQYNYQFI